MPIDYKEYHPKWSLISRLIRFKRAGNKCEGSPKFPDCRAVNGVSHPETGSNVVLTVAHMDHDKENNRFNNLRALCQRCHLGHDINHHIRNRKYGRNHKKNQYNIEFSNNIQGIFNGQPSTIYCETWHFYNEIDQSWSAWIMHGQVVRVSRPDYKQWIGEDAKALDAEMYKKGFNKYFVK